MNGLYVILLIYIIITLAIVTVFLRKKRWVLALCAIVVAFVVWKMADVVRFLPPGYGGDTQPEVAVFDVEVSHQPVLQVIREQEPALFSQLRRQALRMALLGSRSDQIITSLQPQIVALQIKRLQTAPDASVVRYMKVNMQQTALLQNVSDDACFRFLFPAVKGGINAAHILPSEVMALRREVDADMMRAAKGPDSHTVSDSERVQAQKDLMPLLNVLVKTYGQDVTLLSRPQQVKNLVQEGKVCNMVQTLWLSVLALPAPKAAAIVRLSVGFEEQTRLHALVSEVP